MKIECDDSGYRISVLIREVLTEYENSICPGRFSLDPSRGRAIGQRRRWSLQRRHRNTRRTQVESSCADRERPVDK